MSDTVREFLRERGCPDDVIEAGLDGLVQAWERVVGEVERGYEWGLDDYLNDLDGRQLAEDTLLVAAPEDRMVGLRRLRLADDRMKAVVRPIERCLWGDGVADGEEWTPEKNWWYFNVPRRLEGELKEDLEDL